LVGGAENLAKLQTAAKVGGKVYTISTAVGRQVDLFSRQFADNFAVLTSPEINVEIDQKFGKDAAYQIKRQWGIQHLALMLDTDGFKTAQNAISIVSAVDPTGLVGVASAFMHPICKDNTPFPTVHPLYNPLGGSKRGSRSDRARKGVDAHGSSPATATWRCIEFLIAAEICRTGQPWAKPRHEKASGDPQGVEGESPLQ